MASSFSQPLLTVSYHFSSFLSSLIASAKLCSKFLLQLHPTSGTNICTSYLLSYNKPPRKLTGLKKCFLKFILEGSVAWLSGFPDLGLLDEGSRVTGGPVTYPAMRKKSRVSSVHLHHGAWSPRLLHTTLGSKSSYGKQALFHDLFVFHL